MNSIIDMQTEFVAPVAWEKFKRAMLERQIAQENAIAAESVIDAEALEDLQKRAVFS